MQFVHDDSFKGIQPVRLQPKFVKARRLYIGQTFGIVSLLALGFVLIQVNPFGLIPPENQLPLLYGYGIIFGASVPFTLYVLTRRHLTGTQQWFDHCPCCDGHNLRRAPRKWIDRALGSLFQLPLYRYGCTDCAWLGNRIDHGML